MSSEIVLFMGRAFGFAEFHFDFWYRIKDLRILGTYTLAY